MAVAPMAAAPANNLQVPTAPPSPSRGDGAFPPIIMARLDHSKPPGFYYVGYITQKSLDSMPAELREKFPLTTPMSNTKPFRTRKGAMDDAKAHHLRDITVIEN